MDTRTLGFVVLGLSAILFYALYSFTTNTIALNKKLHENCTLPEGVCPFTRTVPSESLFGFLVNGGMVLLGVYLVLIQRKVETVTSTQSKEIKSAIKSLEGNEKKVYGTIASEDGFIFQNELVEKIGLSKVKITRILDKLEGKGLVERRRRGMSNVVVLKHGSSLNGS